jgi:hypothetical protein
MPANRGAWARESLASINTVATIGPISTSLANHRPSGGPYRHRNLALVVSAGILASLSRRGLSLVRYRMCWWLAAAPIAGIPQMLTVNSNVC